MTTVEEIMAALNVDRVTAEEILAVESGESAGDLVVIDDDEPSKPETDGG